VSCAPAGNCSAGGAYAGTGTAEQAFVVNEVNGTAASRSPDARELRDIPAA
jgi:hypothetical protein